MLSWGDQYDQMSASLEKAALQRIELAERANNTEGEDSALEKQLGENDPSEEELLATAEGLSREDTIANLKLLKELIEDPEEDLDPEDAKFFRQVFEITVKSLEEDGGESLSLFLEDREEFHGTHNQDSHGKGGGGGSDTPSPVKASKPKEPGSLRKRARSLTPSGMKSTRYKKGSAFQNEYNYGKYNWNYRPANVGEARKKRTKAVTSRTRWRAAALLTFPLLAVGPYRRRMMGVLAVKKKNHLTAKRQHRSFLATRGDVV